MAPPLEVKDLKDRYKVLADFNGTVLACEQEKCIRSIQGQIKSSIPDIIDRIKEQDQTIGIQMM